MAGTINMQDRMYLNLFEKVTRINTTLCFKYNGFIVFCVPKELVSKAIGEEGRNVKRIYSILGKKVKVIPIPKGIEHVRDFIRAIVSPVEFKSLEIRGNEIILTAGRNKAALIGRDKQRLFEMQSIVKNFFGKEFRII